MTFIFCLEFVFYLFFFFGIDCQLLPANNYKKLQQAQKQYVLKTRFHLDITDTHARSDELGHQVPTLTATMLLTTHVETPSSKRRPLF